MPSNIPNTAESFFNNVLITETCWMWTGPKDGDGYGRMSWLGKTTRAHVISWMIAHSSKPSELFVLHRCDVPACVNPEHLFLGTQTDNNHDRDKKGRHAGAKKTECNRGHHYTPENTRVDRHGKRHCKQCERLRNIGQLAP